MAGLPARRTQKAGVIIESRENFLALPGGLSRSRTAMAEPPEWRPLNPRWVEWLMGFPLGWTALKGSAMPVSRKSSR